MEVEDILEGTKVIGRIVYIGDVTVAMFDVEGAQGIGASKCMPTDKYSKEVGAGIAVARAIRNAGDELEQAWVNRSMTLADWKAKHKKG